MPLVRLQDGPSQWEDIKDAAHLLWRTSYIPDVNNLRVELQNHYQIPSLQATDLYTGLNATRRAVVICNGTKITIAFQGTGNGELHMNTWRDGKGPGWWQLPYAVYEDGNRVHSFFRDMWWAMRQATYDALRCGVEDIAARDVVPEQIVISGFSMGGGVSTMAFTDILHHIRDTYGSVSASPQQWASDENLGNLISHYTFAAVAAADMGYFTILNRLYEQYQIRAWDFMNHWDWTQHTHFLEFRAWRGHRYILPDTVVRHCGSEFGPQGHWILGYLRVCEWMAVNGTDQVKSAYTY